MMSAIYSLVYVNRNYQINVENVSGMGTFTVNSIREDYILIGLMKDGLFVFPDTLNPVENLLFRGLIEVHVVNQTYYRKSGSSFTINEANLKTMFPSDSVGGGSSSSDYTGDFAYDFCKRQGWVPAPYGMPLTAGVDFFEPIFGTVSCNCVVRSSGVDFYLKAGAYAYFERITTVYDLNNVAVLDPVFVCGYYNNI